MLSSWSTWHAARRRAARIEAFARDVQPLLGSPALNKHQAELLSSTLKASLPPQLLPDALAAACTGPAAGGSDAAIPGAAAVSAGGGWNEHTVSALQSVLSAKPALTAAGVAQLLQFEGQGSHRLPAGVALEVLVARSAIALLGQAKRPRFGRHGARGVPLPQRE